MNETEPQTTSTAPSTSRARRRRRSSSKAAGIGPRLRTPQARKAVLAIVGLAGIVFAGATIKSFSNNLDSLASLYFLGPDRAETLYSYGPPARVRSDPAAPWTDVKPGVAIAGFTEWNYVSPDGGDIDVRFDPATGRTAHLACTSEQMIEYACATQFGVAVGDFEDRLVAQIGRPDRQVYRGRDKLMVYSDLGLTFVMRELRVRGIELERADGSAFDRLGRYLRFIVA